MPTAKNFTIEKIDAENFKKIDTRQEITILNIKTLEKQKTELESEVARLNNELSEINAILDEYQKLP
jgi:uncharacterized protein involved in exopolysaccharide biosynthesis